MCDPSLFCLEPYADRNYGHGVCVRVRHTVQMLESSEPEKTGRGIWRKVRLQKVLQLHPHAIVHLSMCKKGILWHYVLYQ